MPKDLQYEEANVVYCPDQDGDGIKCKNYIVCGTVVPDWWYECKGRYTCTNCDCSFGTWTGRDAKTGVLSYHTGKGELNVVPSAECPICFETTVGVSQPRCDHYVCVTCFQRCYYGPKPTVQPEFPYSNAIQEEYETMSMLLLTGGDRQHHERAVNEWITRFPLVRQWENQIQACCDLDEELLAAESSIRRCPICRA